MANQLAYPDARDCMPRERLGCGVRRKRWKWLVISTKLKNCQPNRLTVRAEKLMPVLSVASVEAGRDFVHAGIYILNKATTMFRVSRGEKGEAKASRSGKIPDVT